MSCYALLGNLIGDVTGRLMYTLLLPREDAHDRALHIDPTGVIMIFAVSDPPIQALSTMVDLNIQMQTPYVDRPTRSHKTRIHAVLFICRPSITSNRMLTCHLDTSAI